MYVVDKNDTPLVPYITALKNDWVVLGSSKLQKDFFDEAR